MTVETLAPPMLAAPALGESETEGAGDSPLATDSPFATESDRPSRTEETPAHDTLGLAPLPPTSPKPRKTGRPPLNRTKGTVLQSTEVKDNQINNNHIKEPNSKAKATKKTRATTKEEAQASWQVILLPVEAIAPNPFQPREQFSEEEMEELAASVAQHGVQTPILVRPFRPSEDLPGEASPSEVLPGEASPSKASSDSAIGSALPASDLPTAANKTLFRFELVAGERRLRASIRAKRKTIPAIVRPDISDVQSAEMALIENVQRSNLGIIEEARGYRRLMLRFRFTEARIAKKVGKSVPTIQAAIKLLELPEEVQNLLLKKQLTAAHGHELLKLAAHPLICTSVALMAVAERIPATSLATNPLPNVRELKRRGRVAELGYATKFDWRNTCRECPFKAFVTSGHGSYCLRPDEWKKKQEHAIALEEQEAARVLAEARQGGEASVELTALPPGSYRSLQWNEPPAGCSTQCPCRGQATDPRDASKYIPICLNPERLDELRRAQREALDAERERHYQTMWEDSVQRLAFSPFIPHPEFQAPRGESSTGFAISALPASPNLALLSALPALEAFTKMHQSTSGEVETRSSAKPNEPGASPVIDPVSKEHGEMEWHSRIAWSKVAPLLVLPILSGEKCSYNQRDEWQEKASEVARSLGFLLPWSDIMGGANDSDLLPQLEALPPLPLLFLGAILLLRQEALYAGQWGGETPLLDFVLGLQSARQSELDVTNEDVAPEDMAPEIEASEASDERDQRVESSVTEENLDPTQATEEVSPATQEATLLEPERDSGGEIQGEALEDEPWSESLDVTPDATEEKTQGDATRLEDRGAVA